MKEIDDTPLTKTESERLEALSELLDTDFGVLSRTIQRTDRLLMSLTQRVEELETRLSRLETQRVANEDNQDDPEWY